MVYEEVCIEGIPAKRKRRVISGSDWNYECAKVSSSSNANYMWLNGANSTTEWHANFVSGDVLKVQFKMLKSGDAIMILYKPRY